MIPDPMSEFETPIEREKIVIPKEASAKAFEVYTWDTYYPKKWSKLINGENSFAGFNIWAFIFGTYWFLFKKIKNVGLALFFIQYGIALVAIIAVKAFHFDTSITANIALSLLLAIMLFCGFCANKIYYKTAKQCIDKIIQSRVTEDDFGEVLREKGGSNFGAVIIFGFIGFVIINISRFL